MSLVPWWCLLVHVMGAHGHIYRHGKSWNGYGFHTYPHPATKPVIPRDIMVDVINDLGLKLLAIHNEYNENNIAISPYGALSVLVALGEGVEGEGIYEIHQATHIPNDISVIRVGLRDIHRHLKSYFIPKEGFLAGLTLNHENVTLRPEYEDILRFYGYDTATFNNALYPPPDTTEGPQVSSGEYSTIQPQTTTEMGRTDEVDMTTHGVTEATSEATTAAATTTPLETTTNVVTIADTTPTVQQSTTTQLPQTTEEKTTVVTTVQMSTTTELSSEPTEKVTTTVPQATEESTTTSSTTVQATSTITESPTTDTASTTEAITSSEAPPSTNQLSTLEPVEAGTTTEFTTTQITTLTTNLVSTLTTSTTNVPETTESTRSTTVSSTSTSIIPETTDSSTITLSLVTTEQTSTSFIPETTDSITTSSLFTTVTETAATQDGQDGTPSTTSSADAFLGDNGTLYTSNIDSTNTPTSTTETTTSLTTDITTVSTTTIPNGNDTDKSNEVDSSDSPGDGVGFGGISKRKVRSGATSSNQTNVIKLNNRDALFGGSDNFGFKRHSRSVVDYIIARYYDDQFNFDNNPEPYIPEEPPSFLVYGKYREYNINFMKYNTVLPFHYEPHLNALALSFPLDSTKYYLLLLLPVDETGIDKLICDLRLNGSIKYIIANLKYRHVIATIPSFTLKGYVTLTPSFQKLGIRKVFEPRQADFSLMTNQRGIYVTNIEQAITVTIRNYVDPSNLHHHRNLDRYDPVHFKADHPFLYFVIDSEIHVTLMAGKIVNPLNSRIS